MSTATQRVEGVREELARVGQEHLLNFFDELDKDAQQRLLDQIGTLHLARIPTLVDRYVRSKPAFALPDDVAPAPYYPNRADSAVRPWNREQYRLAGESLLRSGKVAAFTVAGGQGSRLGYDGPKGCFPGGAVTGKPLFQIFAEGILATQRKFGATVPWYIMTSPLNHDATVAFFAENAFLGLERANVMFFQQGVLPSLDMETGRILLADKGMIATNPDGHGGSFMALERSGAVTDMRRRGIEHVSYFQVDNPLVRVLDPVFLGLHAAAPDSSGQMSSKMIPKAYPEEKLGVFCSSRGRVLVIEYSDLPAHLAEQRLEDGTLRFLAGSIAIHVIGVDFIERVNHDDKFDLPYHRAEKKVPCIDPDTGDPIEPNAPNAVKLERFVFDALPLCEQSVVYETERLEEFAPIKNATGVDSVESSRDLQTARAARWLEQAGVSVPRRPDGSPDCVLEISPLTALEATDLTAASLPAAIEPGASVAL